MSTSTSEQSLIQRRFGRYGKCKLTTTKTTFKFFYDSYCQLTSVEIIDSVNVGCGSGGRGMT